MEAAATSQGRLDGAGGISLHYRAWEAEQPAAALVLVHGLFEHSGRYEDIGGAFAGRGISVYALDHRGHGHSGGQRGHVRRFHLLLEDLHRFRGLVEASTAAGAPIILLGHSLGGLITLRYIQEHQAGLAGAVIVSPWLRTAAPAPAWKLRLAGLLGPVLPALPTRAQLDPEDLTHDPERVENYRRDPRIHSRLTPRMYAEVSNAMDEVLSGGERLRLPMLFLLAGEDRIVETRTSLEFARSLPAPDVEVEVLDGLYHEILQEPVRHRVVHRIEAWIRARLP